MLLRGTTAIIYGAGGSLGGAVVRAMAKQGAKVFVTGRRLDPVKALAAEIVASGGSAEAAEVDALDTKGVNDYLTDLVRRVGRLGVSFNAIALQDRQDVPLIEMTQEDFVRPVRIAMETQFITGTAAGRIMKEQRAGVILSLTATPGGIGYSGATGPPPPGFRGIARGPVLALVLSRTNARGPWLRERSPADDHAIALSDGHVAQDLWAGFMRAAPGRFTARGLCSLIDLADSPHIPQRRRRSSRTNTNSDHLAAVFALQRRCFRRSARENKPTSSPGPSSHPGLGQRQQASSHHPR